MPVQEIKNKKERNPFAYTMKLNPVYDGTVNPSFRSTKELFGLDLLKDDVQKPEECQEDFDKLLKENAGKLVVVDFYADWCGPCKRIAPTIKKWADENFPDVVFAKVNVDDNSETAEAEKVSAMPTFKLYKDGNKVDELVGASEDGLKAMIEKHK